MRSIVLSALVLALPLFLVGQVEMPVRLQLDGTTDEDRQVTGLADPVQVDAAVSLDAARAQVMNTTITTGDHLLSGSLIPDLGALVPGMVVVLIPQQTNAAGAMLDLNGTGAHPLVKWGGLPLDSADLPVGIPSRFIFDGTSFQLITPLSRPCPAGTTVGSALYCIDDSSSTERTFFESANACSLRGGRLCSFGEWASGCRRIAGFLATVTAYEWVDSAANNGGDAKTVGGGSSGPSTVNGFACEYGNTREPSLSYRFRCCFDR